MSHWCAENAFKCIKSTCHIQKHTQTLFFSIYCLLLSFVQNACRNIYLVAVAEARACLLISNNYIFFLVFFLSKDSIQFGLGFPFWRFHCTFIRLLTLHLLHLYGCKLCLFSPLLYLYQRIFLEECILFSSRKNSIFPAPILSGCNFSLKLLVSN